MQAWDVSKETWLHYTGTDQSQARAFPTFKKEYNLKRLGPAPRLCVGHALLVGEQHNIKPLLRLLRACLAERNKRSIKPTPSAPRRLHTPVSIKVCMHVVQKLVELLQLPIECTAALHVRRRSDAACLVLFVEFDTVAHLPHGFVAFAHLRVTPCKCGDPKPDSRAASAQRGAPCLPAPAWRLVWE